MKLTQPKEKLATQTPYIEDFTAGTIKLIGTLEILGTITTHLRRGEKQMLVVNILLHAAFVTYGRWL